MTEAADKMYGRGRWAWVAASATLAFLLRGLLPGENDRLTSQAESLAAIDQPWLHPKTALRDYEFLRDRVAEEYGWGQQRVEGAIVEYLRFLQLIAEAPKRELIASSDVDLVWHEHIMDTENYLLDCKRLFGRFLHHRRARTNEEISAIPESYSHTKEVYAERFGVRPPDQFWGSTTTAASMCGGGNKNLDPSASGPVNTGPQPTGQSNSTELAHHPASAAASLAPAAVIVGGLGAWWLAH